MTSRPQIKNLRRIAAFGGAVHRRSNRFDLTGLNVRVVDQLVTLGLLERHSAVNYLGFQDGHDYSITEAGWAEINAHRAPEVAS